MAASTSTSPSVSYATSSSSSSSSSSAFSSSPFDAYSATSTVALSVLSHSQTDSKTIGSIPLSSSSSSSSSKTSPPRDVHQLEEIEKKLRAEWNTTFLPIISPITIEDVHHLTIEQICKLGFTNLLAIVLAHSSFKIEVLLDMLQITSLTNLHDPKTIDAIIAALGKMARLLTLPSGVSIENLNRAFCQLVAFYCKYHPSTSWQQPLRERASFSTDSRMRVLAIFRSMIPKWVEYQKAFYVGLQRKVSDLTLIFASSTSSMLRGNCDAVELGHHHLILVSTTNVPRLFDAVSILFESPEMQIDPPPGFAERDAIDPKTASFLNLTSRIIVPVKEMIHAQINRLTDCQDIFYATNQLNTIRPLLSEIFKNQQHELMAFFARIKAETVSYLRVILELTPSVILQPSSEKQNQAFSTLLQNFTSYAYKKWAAQPELLNLFKELTIKAPDIDISEECTKEYEAFKKEYGLLPQEDLYLRTLQESILRSTWLLLGNTFVKSHRLTEALNLPISTQRIIAHFLTMVAINYLMQWIANMKEDVSFYKHIENLFSYSCQSTEAQTADLAGRRLLLSHVQSSQLSHVASYGKKDFPDQNFFIKIMARLNLSLYLQEEYIRACHTFIPSPEVLLEEQESKANAVWYHLLEELDQEDLQAELTAAEQEEKEKASSSSSSSGSDRRKGTERKQAKTPPLAKKAVASSGTSSSSSSQTSPTRSITSTPSLIDHVSGLVEKVGRCLKMHYAPGAERVVGREKRLGDVLLNLRTCRTALNAGAVEEFNGNGHQVLDSLFGYVILEKQVKDTKTARRKLPHDIVELSKLFEIDLPEGFWKSNAKLSLTARYPGRYRSVTEATTTAQGSIESFFQLIQIITMTWRKHRPQDEKYLAEIEGDTKRLSSSLKTTPLSPLLPSCSIDSSSAAMVSALKAHASNFTAMASALTKLNSSALSDTFIRTQLTSIQILVNTTCTNLLTPSATMVENMHWSLLFSRIGSTTHSIVENSMLICAKKANTFIVFNHQFNSRQYGLANELSPDSRETLDQLGELSTAFSRPFAFMAKMPSVGDKAPSIPMLLRLLLDLHHATNDVFEWHRPLETGRAAALRERVIPITNRLLTLSFELITKTLPRVLRD